MTLTDIYLAQIESQVLQQDPAQRLAVAALDNVRQSLEAGNKGQSLYLYGPVGRGKTMLMDLFFEHLSGVTKQRLHFHHFMAQVHQALNTLQGTINPLQQVAKDWASKAKVLCFDEFFVTDIGDAMIMARLFEALFKEDVILVTTSNAHPEQLYHNGLARERFLPTIALLLSECEVINVAGEVDHRFAHGAHYTHYFVQNQTHFFAQFERAHGVLETAQIEICRREVEILGKSEHGYLFDFMALCSTPRATADYIELAQNHRAIFISKVPKMGAEPDEKRVTQGIEDGYQRAHSSIQNARFDDEARRFIALVDECYEQRCLLVIDAQCDLSELYVGEQLAFAFERTKSRLVEMQSWSFR
jgi:cell division protein ZapE